jgi:hypothetical protein
MVTNIGIGPLHRYSDSVAAWRNMPVARWENLRGSEGDAFGEADTAEEA